MAAAVSNSGGLKMLACLRRNADEVRPLISETRELTNWPFGANFTLLGLDGASERIDAFLEARVGLSHSIGTNPANV